MADGEAIDTSAAGSFSFTVHAADTAGNTAERTVAYSVEEDDSGGGFEFEGFFSPLDEAPPALNRVKAGKDVPVRFRLGGDQGEDVFADGFPRSARVPCGQDADPDDGQVDALAVVVAPVARRRRSIQPLDRDVHLPMEDRSATGRGPVDS